MDRTTLVNFVQQYLDNTNPDFVSAMDTFIQTAETNISETVILPNARTETSFNLVIGERLVNAPVGLRSVISWAVIDGTNHLYLKPVEPDFIRSAYPNPALLDRPTRYAPQDNTKFILGPTPDKPYTCVLQYEVRPDSLTSVTQGTWLSQQGTQALKWGVIYQAYLWMKGDKDTLAEYEKQLAIAVGQLRTLVEGRRRRDSFRDGEPRLP